jgi:hypothetical protein
VRPYPRIYIRLQSVLHSLVDPARRFRLALRWGFLRANVGVRLPHFDLSWLMVSWAFLQGSTGSMGSRMSPDNKNRLVRDRFAEICRTDTYLLTRTIASFVPRRLARSVDYSCSVRLLLTRAMQVLLINLATWSLQQRPKSKRLSGMLACNAPSEASRLFKSPIRVHTRTIYHGQDLPDYGKIQGYLTGVVRDGIL